MLGRKWLNTFKNTFGLDTWRAILRAAPGLAWITGPDAEAFNRTERKTLLAELDLGAIILRDCDGRIRYWSAGCAALYGYTPEEAVGKAVHDLLGTAFPLPLSEIEAALERDGEWRGEVRQRHKDGHEMIIAAHVMSRRNRGRASTVVDVTAHRQKEIAFRAEQADGQRRLERLIEETALALRESEDRLRVMVENVTDYAIFMLDAQGNVKNWNPGARRIKGYTAHEIIGQHFSCFYTQEDQAAGEPAGVLERAAREGRYETQGWRVRKDGTPFWASIIIYTIRANDGQLIGFTKVVRDTTEHRQTQLALQEAQKRLFKAQKMEAVGQLTGGVAHDFNNLLQAVSGNLELVQLSSEQGDEERVRELLEVLQRAIGRGARLTAQLLAFSRRQILHPERVLITDLITETADLIRRALGETITFEMRAEAGLWPCHIDPAQFEAAILNLALNARDAMRTGGTLTVSMANVPLGTNKPETFNGTASGDYVRIDISDTGSGMTEEVRAHAFEPFFTTKEVGQGSGLGLAQVHGFVYQSDGAISIDSAPGQGTRISLFFPRAAAPDLEREAVSDDAEQVRGEPARGAVLLVEDDPTVLRAVQMGLVSAGYRVVVAHDASKALSVLRSGIELEMLFSDVVLPGGISGLELAREARKMYPRLPVLLTSGYPVDVLTRHGGKAEFEILAKPYRIEKLLRRIAELTREAAA